MLTTVGSGVGGGATKRRALLEGAVGSEDDLCQHTATQTLLIWNPVG
jgi:hypothetical protein